VKITLVLADTGRQTPAGLSLLQVGWKSTFGASQPDGSFILPEQAVVVFVEAEFSEINRVYSTDLWLVDRDNNPQQFNTPNGPIDAEVHRQVLIPQVMGASIGVDSSLATVFYDFPMGNIRVKEVPGWYRWMFKLDNGETGETGFMVNPAPVQPSFGPLAGGTNPA
jgi:hypothetical protein